MSDTPSAMPQPPFTMSKYGSELHLLRDKSAWLEGEVTRLAQALSAETAMLDIVAKEREEARSSLSESARETERLRILIAEEGGEAHIAKMGLYVYEQDLAVFDLIQEVKALRRGVGVTYGVTDDPLSYTADPVRRLCIIEMSDRAQHLRSIQMCKDAIAKTDAIPYTSKDKAREDYAGTLEKKLERVMIGGNHLASILVDRLGPDFATSFPPTMDHDDALEELGATMIYDVWCCWRAIMCARDDLAPPSQVGTSDSEIIDACEAWLRDRPASWDPTVNLMALAAFSAGARWRLESPVQVREEKTCK